jgi:tetratricopeptide (TPR) repeat protein
MKREARRILNMTTAPAAPSTHDSLIRELKDLGFNYIRDNDYSSAQFAFKKVLDLNNKDIDARFVYAHLIEDGTHRKHAESRDLLLSILDDNPAILENPTETNLKLIRGAAERCSNIGPFAKAIELFRKLARASNEASDYFQLSEALTRRNLFAESISSLEKAIALDPATYDTKTNRETLEIARSRLSQATSKAANGKRKIGRYPETEEFLGDFQKLIRDHIAVNLDNEPKFLNKNTKFFTMGSCFARNLAISLIASGYTSHYMQISEHINTTFANRVFVDWLSDAEIDSAIRDRIVELLPPGWSKENTLQLIKNSDVFILTLGVAAAFFDRATGDFVLPRPSALNSRVLAEKYLFRTTSVKENVENVLYLIEFIRSVSPHMKIVVTVSPIPMLASFEYESAVQADCLSKSTMRLVAHEVVNSSNISNILYWPSFEIFRWAGSNSSNYYAADDGAAWHVSEEKIAGTIRAFVEMFSSA